MATEPQEVWGDLATSAFIGASVLFKTLDDASREDLLKLARLQTFEAGEVVVRQGEGGEDFFLVRDGQAAVTTEREGRTVELGTLGRGAYFGEFIVLGEAVRVATITASSALSVIRFPAPIIGALAERFPRVKKLLEVLREARRKDTAAEPSG